MSGIIGWRTSRKFLDSEDSTVEDTVGCEFIPQRMAVAV